MYQGGRAGRGIRPTCWLGCIPPCREKGPALGVSTSLACIRVAPPRIVESIIILIIIIDDPVESGPAHFCSTVQLELLFFQESLFLHHKVMGRQIWSVVVAAGFLHARAADLVFTFNTHCEY